MDKDTTFLAHALRYALHGLRVFPCKPRGKEPLISDWPNQATTDPARIREWWGKWPEANIGVLCGAGLAVLDFDPRNGGDWLDYDLPDTVVCHTGGGGRHYYFAAPPGVRGRKVDAGLDLKGEGGYVIAPPSIHPSGGAYVWEMGAAPWETSLAPLPAWVLGGDAPNNPLWRAYKGRTIPEGQRNMVLFSYACHLRRHGAGEGEILDELERWNERCVPPLDARELVRIAKSASRYAPAHNTRTGGAAGEKSPKARGKRDQAFEVLSQSRWVRYRGRVYIADGGVLYSIEEAYSYLTERGVFVAASTGAELARAVVSSKERLGQIESLDGSVVLLDPAPRYGSACGIEGVFFRHKEKLWCYTPDGLIEVKEGVYYRLSASLPAMPEGQLFDLLVYIKLALANLTSPHDPRVALAAVAPVLLGLGNAGLLLEGPGGSGKSTAGKALYRLAHLEDPATPIGDSKRDLLATLIDRRIVFHDDLEAMDQTQEDLIRIGITGGIATARELYTTQSVELVLSGSAIVCGVSVGFRNPTTLERFVRLGFSPKARASERELESLFRESAPRALGGLLELYAKASRIPPPPADEHGEVRLRNWYSWALRFAKALGVEREFRDWLADMAGQLIERLGGWSGLYYMLRGGELSEGKYLLSDLAKLTLERSGEAVGESQVRGMVRRATANAGQELITIAGKCGYDLHLYKERDQKSRKLRWFVEIRRSTYSPLAKEAVAEWAHFVLATAPTAEPGPAIAAERPEVANPTLTAPSARSAGDGDSAVGGWGSWGEIREYIERSVRDMLWPHRAKILAMRNEVMKGIDPRGPMGALVVRLFGLMDSLIGLAGNLQARQIEVQLWPDIPEKGQELGEIKQLWADLQHIVGLIERHTELFGKAATLAMIEAAPGRLWYANRGVLDKLRAAGFGDTADRHGDMIQERDGYQARLGMAFIAWEVWGRREENPEGFVRVWPGLRIHLENALGEGWPNLLGIPDEPPSMELPF